MFGYPVLFGLSVLYPNLTDRRFWWADREPGVTGIDQLDPVAERVVDVTTPDRQDAVVLLDRHAGSDRALSRAASRSRTRSAGWAFASGVNSPLDPQVDRRSSAREPAAAAAGQLGRLLHLQEPQHGTVELRALPPRHRPASRAGCDRSRRSRSRRRLGLGLRLRRLPGLGRLRCRSIGRCPPSAWASASLPATRRSRPSTPRCPGRPTGRSPTPAAPGRVVRSSGTWIRLTRTRYHSGRPPAHPVDQDVGRFEVPGDVAVTLLPTLEAGHRLVLELGPGDLDDRDRRLAAAGRVGREPTHSVGSPAFGSPAATAAARSAATSGGGPPASAATRLVFRRRPPRLRRLDARRLTGLLRVVRWPWGVAEALRLVLARSAPGARRATRPPRRSRPPGRRSRRTGRARCRS